MFNYRIVASTLWVVEGREQCRGRKRRRTTKMCLIALSLYLSQFAVPVSKVEIKFHFRFVVFRKIIKVEKPECNLLNHYWQVKERRERVVGWAGWITGFSRAQGKGSNKGTGMNRMELRIYNDGKLRIKMKMNLCVLCNFHSQRLAIVLRSRRLFHFIFFCNFLIIFFCCRKTSRISKQAPGRLQGASFTILPPTWIAFQRIFIARFFQFRFNPFFCSRFGILNPHKYFILLQSATVGGLRACCWYENVWKEVNLHLRHLGGINLT